MCADVSTITKRFRHFSYFFQYIFFYCQGHPLIIKCVYYMVQDLLEVGVAPAIFRCIFIPPSMWSRSCQRLKYIRRQRSGGVAPADTKYLLALNMPEPIARPTSLFQLFIYMNNCLQFWSGVAITMALFCLSFLLMTYLLTLKLRG